MVYKSLADIIDAIRDSVDIIDIMKSVYNFKASENDAPWKKKNDANKMKDTDATSAPAPNIIVKNNTENK